MDVCLLSQDGAILLHRHMQAAPAPFLKAVAPDRDGLVVAVACLFTWYGRADLCADDGRPCVLGPALSLPAMPGGKATNDTSDAHKMAAWLRGGLLPQASVSPAARRAPRALLRRRTHLLRTRAALLAPVHKTTSPYNLPELGQQMADKAKRDGVAERCAEAAVHKTIAVDLALLTSDDALRKDLALSLLTTATPHDAHTLYLRPTVPGIGQMLSLVRLSASPRIDRCPCVPAFASDARLVKGRTASGGKRWGTSGQKIGHAHLTGAFAEAATLFVRHTPQGQKLWARLENKQATGKALSLLAHPLGRAVSCMRKRQVACERARFLQTSGSRADEPGASLDAEGRSLSRASSQPSPAASLNAKARRGRCSLRPRAGWDTRSGSCKDGDGRLRWRVRPLPRARHELASHLCAARLLRRTGGGHGLIARSQSITPTELCHRHSRDERTAIRVWCRPVGGWPRAQTSRSYRRPMAGHAGSREAEKKKKTAP
jgi:Transposase IS116/IS110/IS902 family